MTTISATTQNQQNLSLNREISYRKFPGGNYFEGRVSTASTILFKFITPHEIQQNKLKEILEITENMNRTSVNFACSEEPSNLTDRINYWNGLKTRWISLQELLTLEIDNNIYTDKIPAIIARKEDHPVLKEYEKVIQVLLEAEKRNNFTTVLETCSKINRMTLNLLRTVQKTADGYIASLRSSIQRPEESKGENSRSNIDNTSDIPLFANTQNQTSSLVQFSFQEQFEILATPFQAPEASSQIPATPLAIPAQPAAPAVHQLNLIQNLSKQYTPLTLALAFFNAYSKADPENEVGINFALQLIEMMPGSFSHSSSDPTSSPHQHQPSELIQPNQEFYEVKDQSNFTSGNQSVNHAPEEQDLHHQTQSDATETLPQSETDQMSIQELSVIFEPIHFVEALILALSKQNTDNSLALEILSEFKINFLNQAALFTPAHQFAEASIIQPAPAVQAPLLAAQSVPAGVFEAQQPASAPVNDQFPDQAPIAQATDNDLRAEPVPQEAPAAQPVPAKVVKAQQPAPAASAPISSINTKNRKKNRRGAQKARN